MDVFKITTIILLFIILILIIKYNVEKQNKWQNEINRRKAEIDEQLSEYIEQSNQIKTKLYEEQLSKRNEVDKQNELYYSQSKSKIESRLLEARNSADIEIARQKQMLNELNTSYQEALASYESRLQEQKNLMLKAFDEGAISYREMADNVIEEIEAEIKEKQSILNDYQIKVQAINEEILRNRAIAEQQDFYRIQILPENIEDIEIIKSIREKLHKREYLDKMLYDNYINKSVKEMAKRVLNGKDPSGIYRITNIKTKEAYIGKSTQVSTRWTNHVKSACGLEGVADSQFQRALKKYGVENWTFELLEECPKDKLTEREKYYIELYGTKEYGYNQRLG